MNDRTFFVETWGCQMNAHDSERIAGLLLAQGYRLAARPESAAVIVLNTCCVRDKAVQKFYTRLGRLARLKGRGRGGEGGNEALAGPVPLLCVTGCVAQQEAADLLEKQPAVDLIVGTRRIGDLPALLDRARAGLVPAVSADLVNDSPSSVETVLPAAGKRKAFLTIMEGCDNFCAYCIVPYVRGRERSRGSGEVLEEARLLIRAGVREIELLGQNVNSYRDGDFTFPRLLRSVARLPGLLRLRFTVSHPRDFTAELARVMADEETVCPHLHLPMQSGSDRILQAMGRAYTREDYLRKAHLVRDYIPEVALSSDFIVGFPGEREEDFRDTLRALEELRFDAVFSFKFSPRPGTRAAELADDVPLEVKGARLRALQELQRQLQMEKNAQRVGRVTEVIVAGRSARGEAGRYSGRDGGNRVINFDYPTARRPAGWPENPLGSLARVRIVRSHPNSLFAEIIDLLDIP